jgi:hypothetical protein
LFSLKLSFLQKNFLILFFVQVISRKDQAQYWHRTEVPYSYVSVDMFSRKFKESPYGKKLDVELSEPYDKSQSHQNALSFSPYSLSKWELFRACASRELLLMKRSSFIYIFKTTQVKMICTFVYVPRSFMLIFFSWVGALKLMLILPITILYLLCQRPCKI